MNIEAGPSGVGLAGSIVNEGPVSRVALENTMTIAKFDPVGEIVFKQAEAVAAAAWEASEPALPELQPALQRDEPLPQEAVLPVVLPRTEPLVAPQIELQVGPAPKTETRVFSRVSPAVSPQPQEQEAVEEEILVENRLPDEHEVLEEKEETENFELKDLLDEEVSDQRVHDIGKAIDLARAAADREGVSGIEGWRIIKFISFHIGLLSQIVRKKGRDGSLDETVEELSARRFGSAEEAKEKSKVIVSHNEPVRKGKEGKKVGEEAVAKVLRHQLVKGSQEPAPVLSDVTSEVRETSLADYPELAEIFQG